MNNLWKPSENQWVTEAILRIETLKYNIKLATLKEQKLLSKQDEVELAIKKLKSNIKYLKDEARIVTIKSYKSVCFGLASMLEIKVNISKELTQIRGIIKEMEAEMAVVQNDLPKLQSKILEFKK